jgi:hypothetical protein
MKYRLQALFVVIVALIVATPAHVHADGSVHVHTAQTNVIDLKKLPLGDNLHSTAPKVGTIWPCRIEPGGPGAGVDGPWINKQAGTFDYTAKIAVSGAVEWKQHQFSAQVTGNKRILKTNNLPPHTTGIFPVARNDKAYQYDRNPNRIAAQNMQIELAANPVFAPQPGCTPGAVGVLLSGVVLFNALDAPGRDAVAHELQDSCQGHPQMTSTYHYHNLTTCIEDVPLPDGHSALMGYALDGFGIYGKLGERGAALTSADLDECHGHTHQIDWDGRQIAMYHYHATWDFPYTIGCMRGTFSMENMRIISGGGGNAGNGGGNPPPPPPPRR